METKVKRGFIYGLYSSDGELRYVGKTRKSPIIRYKQHLKASRLISSKTNSWYYTTYVYNWLRCNQEAYLKIIQEFEFIQNNQLCEVEIYWINYFKESGCRLVNLAFGGQGGGLYTWTDERRKAQSDKMKNQMNDPVFRAKNQAVVVGNQFCKNRKMTESNRLKLKKYHELYYSNNDNRLKASIKAGGKPFKDQFGNIYLMVNETARKLNLRPNSISMVLNGHRNRIKGYRFSFIDAD